MTAELLAWFGSALAFVVAMSATPGPNNAMLAASGANFGFRRTLPHMLGIATGFPAMVLAVALGAGQVLRTNPWAHEALRWVGAAYMFWLAVRIARTDPAAASTNGAARSSRPLSALQAALFQWVNPKAWITAVGAVVTYTSGAAVTGQAGALAAMFLLVSVPVTAFWTMIGVGAARTFRSTQALRRFNLAMAALLVMSLAGLFLE